MSAEVHFLVRHAPGGKFAALRALGAMPVVMPTSTYELFDTADAALDAINRQGHDGYVHKECMWQPTSWHEVPAAARELWLAHEQQLADDGVPAGSDAHAIARAAFEAGFVAAHGTESPIR